MNQLALLRDVFTAYLQSHAFTQEPVELYEPNNYFLSLGGKRLRPIMVLLGNELYGGKAEEALPAAMAIEYFHNFSLIHDDVMDAAPLRRGKQTVHEKYGLNTAILSGDALLVYAYKYIAEVPARHLSEVLNIFNQTAIEVCEGQQRDMNFESREDVSEEEYLFMIRQKTSVVLAAALQIGAIIGGASRQDANALYEYAIDLGVAFQIQDDILDCYGKAELVGKQPGGDIIQNKNTLLLIRARAYAQQISDERLAALLTQANPISKTEKVEGVLALYNEWGIRESVTAKRNSLIDSALRHLDGTSLPQAQKDILAQLVDHLVIRTF
jgi:geranylgeranyl diphosphate synthase, type II